MVLEIANTIACLPIRVYNLVVSFHQRLSGGGYSPLRSYFIGSCGEQNCHRRNAQNGLLQAIIAAVIFAGCRGVLVPELENYESALLIRLEHDYGLQHGFARDLVLDDRGCGNDGSTFHQQQALDRLVMLAIETLWSAP